MRTQQHCWEQDDCYLLSGLTAIKKWCLILMVCLFEREWAECLKWKKKTRTNCKRIFLLQRIFESEMELSTDDYLLSLNNLSLLKEKWHSINAETTCDKCHISEASKFSHIMWESYLEVVLSSQKCSLNLMAWKNTAFASSKMWLENMTNTLSLEMIRHWELGKNNLK